MSISLKTEKKNRSGESGAMLIVVLGIMILAGVIMNLGIGALKTEDSIDRNFETLDRAEYAMDQLASYVHRHRRLPCPADEGLVSTTAAFGQSDVAGVPNQCNNNVGILPFRTLNLMEKDAKDAWGQYFTYAVSPVFADLPNHNVAGAFAGDGSIFFTCLIERWMDYDQVDPPLPTPVTNENRMKARFCCPSPTTYVPGTDLDVEDVAGTSLISPRDSEDGDTHRYIEFSSLTEDDVALFSPADLARSATGMAVVLVSHGANGLGALLSDGAVSLAPPAATDELENADGDQTFVDRPISLVPGANYFDDIIIWRTQMSLYGELGNASCFSPWD